MMDKKTAVGDCEEEYITSFDVTTTCDEAPSCAIWTGRLVDQWQFGLSNFGTFWVSQ